MRCLAVNNKGHEQRTKPTPTTLDLRSLTVENLMCQKMQGNNGFVNIVKSPVSATSYNISTLQGATNSFSQENLVGEGTLGRVYRGQFHNGKVCELVSFFCFFNYFHVNNMNAYLFKTPIKALNEFKRERLHSKFK